MSHDSERHTIPKLVALTPAEVRSLLRPRSGFEAFIAPLLDLYHSRREQLQMPGLDPESLLDELAAYEALLALEAETKAQLTRIQKTRLLHASNLWRAMLEIYVRAQALARSDTWVMRAIGDFATFMKNGPRKKPTAAAPAASH